MKANRGDWDPASQAGEETVDTETGKDLPVAQVGIEPVRASALGEAPIGSGDVTAFAKALRKYDLSGGLGLADLGRLESTRISFAKAIGSIDAWGKASSHFHSPVPVAAVIAAQPAWDSEGAEQALERLSIDPDRPLEDLTEEQRDQVIRLLLVGDDIEA